jgi:transaldolase
MKKALALVRANRNAQVLWASSRELLNIMQAQSCGCHIITLTQDILRKIPLIGKDLNDLSLDTVRMFHRDGQSSGYKF